MELRQKIESWYNNQKILLTTSKPAGNKWNRISKDVSIGYSVDPARIIIRPKEAPFTVYEFDSHNAIIITYVGMAGEFVTRRDVVVETGFSDFVFGVPKDFIVYIEKDHYFLENVKKKHGRITFCLLDDNGMYNDTITFLYNEKTDTFETAPQKGTCVREEYVERIKYRFNFKNDEPDQTTKKQKIKNSQAELSLEYIQKNITRPIVFKCADGATYETNALLWLGHLDPLKAFSPENKTVYTSTTMKETEDVVLYGVTKNEYDLQVVDSLDYYGVKRDMSQLYWNYDLTEGVNHPVDHIRLAVWNRQTCRTDKSWYNLVNSEYREEFIEFLSNLN